MAWEHRHTGWVGSNDGQQDAYAPPAGAVALLSGHRDGPSDLHDSKVRSSPYTPSSDHQWSAGSVSSLSLFQEVKENHMSDIGTVIAVVLSSYIFGAATGRYAWDWLKSRGQKW